MPRKCSVPGCRSNYKNKSSVVKYVSCYGFPSDPDLLTKWLNAIGRPDFAPSYDSAVCAKHFDTSSFVTEDMYRKPNGELKVFKFAKPKLKSESVPVGVSGKENLDEKIGRRVKSQEKNCLDLVEVVMDDAGRAEENLDGYGNRQVLTVKSLQELQVNEGDRSRCCEEQVADENGVLNLVCRKTEIASEDEKNELRFGGLPAGKTDDFDERGEGGGEVVGNSGPGETGTGTGSVDESRGGKCPSEGTASGDPGGEWGGRCVVKEELFEGLGLVRRGALHDSGRSPVDRRHCVTERRRSHCARPSPPKPVFYPSGSTMFDTEKFIGEIQIRPAIYDIRSKVYSNRVAKLKYWHEVGKEMYKGWDGLDQMEKRTLVKELQIKWKSIRDHFMRQLKANMNGEGPKKKKYVHFDQLQFLTANLGVKRPRHSYKAPKTEPDEEYIELTPELPEDRHFTFMTSVERSNYDEREVPVASSLPPQQPEDLSYHHHKELPYYQPRDLSFHKELEGDRMGNKMFLLSLLPIMERLPDHANIRARLQLMEVLQSFVAHEDTLRDFYGYQDEKQSCGETSQPQSTASHSDSDT